MIEFGDIPGVEKLGKGGQATVYKVPPGALHPKITEPVAIKKYSAKILRGNGRAIEQYLKMMLEVRKNAPQDIRRTIDQYTIWPRVVVYDNGEACGFAMNMIPEKFFARYRDVSGPVTAESNFDFILNDDCTRRRFGLPAVDAAGRAKITGDLLHIISQLHRYGIIAGDISPNNILAYVDRDRQDRNRVLLIDADSFRKANHTHPLKQPHTPNWYPPESWSARLRRLEIEKNGGDQNLVLRHRAMEFIQNTQTDVYKVCLAVMRLYHDGAQRTSVSGSPGAYNNITRELGEEFAQYIFNGLSAEPAERPSGQELHMCFRYAAYGRV